MRKAVTRHTQTCVAFTGPSVRNGVASRTSAQCCFFSEADLTQAKEALMTGAMSHGKISQYETLLQLSLANRGDAVR